MRKSTFAGYHPAVHAAYFLLVLVVVGLATAIISRRVFYIEK